METNEIDNILKTHVEKNNSPSVQYLFFNTDSVIHQFNYGLANVKEQKQTNNNTTYNAFSVSKTFTALAILQLAEQGKLNIDHSAKHYLNEFPYSQDITIRQLLAHTSGIPNPLPLRWVHLHEEKELFNRNLFFKQVFEENKKVKSKPNEKYTYSNLGYFLLGQIIEEVSGMKYEEYIHNNILKPINVGKNEMDFIVNDPNYHAKGYQKQLSFTNFLLSFMMDKSKCMGKSEGKWKPFNNIYINGTSYGGLIGTAGAFMKYAQELLKPDCQLLSEKYKEMLFAENFTNSGKATGMCLSWHKGQLNGHEYLTHAGGGGGYYCELRLYPKLGVGSVIMFNSSGMTDQRFLDKLDKYLIDKKH